MLKFGKNVREVVSLIFPLSFKTHKVLVSLEEKMKEVVSLKSSTNKNINN